MQALPPRPAPDGPTVGSWPGHGYVHNAFMKIFLDALAGAGCRVTSLETVDAIAAAPAPDILLLHWAEQVFWESPDRWTLLAKIRRLLRLLDRRPAGTRTVWLAHNLHPHEARGLKQAIWRPYAEALSRRVDAVMTLSPGTLAPVREAFPALAGKAAGYVHHPLYPEARVPEARRAALRQARGWGDDVRVIGYCGQIRPYKGVPALVAAFRETALPHLRLHIAGRCLAPALERELRDAAAADPRIGLDLRNLPEPDFRDALALCDLFAAPFRDYLHSGSLVHALSAHRPVLTPATPFARALRDEVGGGWVRTYEGPLTGALLERAAQAAPVAPPRLARLGPGAVGHEAAAFFRGLLAPAGARSGAS